MALQVRQVFNPLRLHCLLNILGDVCLICSGIGYMNPLRVAAAGLGSSTHMLGILFPERKLFKLSMTDIVMRVVFVCGVLYMLSGSNFFGFEETPRYAESLGGLFISCAALSVMFEKGKLVAILFASATTAFSFSAFEVFFTRGEIDWFVLLGSVMFYSAGFVAMYIKKENGPVA